MDILGDFDKKEMNVLFTALLSCAEDNLGKKEDILEKVYNFYKYAEDAPIHSFTYEIVSKLNSMGYEIKLKNNA